MERMESQLKSELEELLEQESSDTTTIPIDESEEIISDINKEVEEFNLLNNEKLNESQIQSSETYLTH